MRTGSSSYFSAEEVSWLGWAATWAMVLVAKVGCCWAGVAREVSLLFFLIFFSVLFFSCFVIAYLISVLNSISFVGFACLNYY
jgi:hypothetical protein